MNLRLILSIANLAGLILSFNSKVINSIKTYLKNRKIKKEYKNVEKKTDEGNVDELNEIIKNS